MFVQHERTDLKCSGYSVACIFFLVENIAVSNYNVAMMFWQGMKTCKHSSISDRVSSLTLVCVLPHPRLRATCWIQDTLITCSHTIDVTRRAQATASSVKKLSGLLASLHLRQSVTRRFGRDSLFFFPSCINKSCEKK